MPNVVSQFVMILNKMSDICPLEAYNYAEPTISVLFKLFENDPYKNAEVLLVLEIICSKNKEHIGLKEYFSSRLNQLTSRFSQLLQGKWEDTEFFTYFIKFFGSLLCLTKSSLLQAQDFTQISAQIMGIYDRINNYEIRRDILKFW